MKDAAWTQTLDPQVNNPRGRRGYSWARDIRDLPATLAEQSLDIARQLTETTPCHQNSSVATRISSASQVAASGLPSTHRPRPSRIDDPAKRYIRSARVHRPT